MISEPGSRTYPWAEYAILVVMTFLAIELKRPFGLLAHQVFGPPGTGTGPTFALSVPEMAQIGAVILACIIHQWSTLPAAPWLERVLYRWHSDKPIMIWRPALVATGVIIAFTLVYSIVVSHFGFTSKLGSQLSAPSLPKSVVVKLALLYPLAAIGAAISEELVYRFAILSLLLAVVYLLVPRARERSATWIWIAIVVGGLYFGYVHVAENIETVRTGSLALDVLTTPQTWAGFVFGYVFWKYGLEAAMVTHAATDLTAPLALKVLQLLHG